MRNRRAGSYTVIIPDPQTATCVCAPCWAVPPAAALSHESARAVTELNSLKTHLASSLCSRIILIVNSMSVNIAQ
eukprot:3814386-Prymnesium_polylepis.1